MIVCITFPFAVPVTIPGGPTVLADEILLEPDAPTATIEFVSDLRLRVTDIPQFTLIDEAIGIFGLANRAAGEARLEPGGDHLIVSNIGSSGEDGVSIDVGETLDLFTAEAAVDPALLVVGARGVATAIGEVAGVAGLAVSRLTAEVLSTQPTAEVQITPDFSPLGATTSSVELFLNDMLVFSQSGLSGPGCKFPPPPTCRGKCGPCPGGTVVVMAVEFPAAAIPVTIPGGPTILADRIVMKPDTQLLSAGPVSEIQLRVTDLPLFDLLTEGFVPPTPPVANLNCMVGAGATVAVSWSNPVTYDVIRIYANGVLTQTLPGNATTTVVNGLAGTRDICVEGVIRIVPSPQTCCTVTVPVPAVSGLMCTPGSAPGNVDVSWTNGGNYDSILVYVNGVAGPPLPGTATSTTVPGIVGTRTICVEPIVAGIAGPQTCCTVTGSVPPVTGLTCALGAVQGDVIVAWTNGGTYDSINVYLNGTLLAPPLPGGATTTTVSGVSGTRQICIEPVIAGVAGPQVCCTVTVPVPPVTGLTCALGAVQGDVVVAWTNGGTYDSINVYLNGTLLAPALPGGATTTTVSGVSGTRQICIEPVVGGVAGPQVCCTITVPAVPRFIRTDCNADGGKNIADAVFLLTFLFGGGAAPACDDACDCNDDEVLNIGDAVCILNALFGGGGPPPPPWPICGPDPTPGALRCASFPPCP